MTQSWTKCTAIRRIIVPENLVGDVQNALSKALTKQNWKSIKQRNQNGFIVGKEQMQILEEK